MGRVGSTATSMPRCWAVRALLHFVWPSNDPGPGQDRVKAGQGPVLPSRARRLDPGPRQAPPSPGRARPRRPGGHGARGPCGRPGAAHHPARHRRGGGGGGGRRRGGTPQPAEPPVSASPGGTRGGGGSGSAPGPGGCPGPSGCAGRCGRKTPRARRGELLSDVGCVSGGSLRGCLLNQRRKVSWKM